MPLAVERSSGVTVGTKGRARSVLTGGCESGLISRALVKRWPYRCGMAAPRRQRSLWLGGDWRPGDPPRPWALRIMYPHHEDTPPALALVTLFALSMFGAEITSANFVHRRWFGFLFDLLFFGGAVLLPYAWRTAQILRRRT